MTRTWNCTICGVEWYTDQGVPAHCPVCRSRGMVEVMPIPTVRPLRWGGLDFDTAELDAEILDVLARIAPEGGDLRFMLPSAPLRSAVQAAEQDRSWMRSERQRALGADLEDETVDERALAQMIGVLSALEDAQRALFEANDRLLAVRRLLGDV